VQQFGPGTVYSCAGVFAGDQLLALSLARYLRTWPPDAGSAALAETIPVCDELASQVSAVLRTLGWYGIFELELLRRPDGGYAALDLNPRPYGSLALAIRAGADLPRIWCGWLLGERPEPVRARPGISYRWEDAELRRFLWELRGGRLRAAAAVARPRAATTHPLLHWDDPAPVLAQAIGLGNRAIRRARSRRSR
jgi:predicted ATP-grasp superfamily ATP-dependent carboligase